MTSIELKQSPAVPVVLGVIITLLGLGLGFAAPPLAGVLVSVIERTPFPVPGVIDLVSDLSPAWSVPILGALGAVAGLVVAHSAATEALRLTVAPDHLEYRQNDREGWIERADVAAAYRDRRYLVLLGHEDRVRSRLEADALNEERLKDTLLAFEYPWMDQDPHEESYVPWVDGRPDFSATEHSLLRQWKPKNTEDRIRFEQELGQHHLVARERGGKLQVRRGAT